LKKARFTEFGQQYHFDQALLSKHPGKKFQELVPVHDYNKIYEDWWKKTLDGVPDVTWPGKIKYYALSSGTSEAASKYIPVTKELLRSNTINYVRQFISLIKYEDAPIDASADLSLWEELAPVVGSTIADVNALLSDLNHRLDDFTAEEVAARLSDAGFDAQVRQTG